MKTFYSKAATRKRLEVGRTRYKHLIASSILAKPIEIVLGARPVHTEDQIQAAENNLYKKVVKDLLPKDALKFKPLSAKLLSEIS